MEKKSFFLKKKKNLAKKTLKRKPHERQKQKEKTFLKPKKRNNHFKKKTCFRTIFKKKKISKHKTSLFYPQKKNFV